MKRAELNRIICECYCKYGEGKKCKDCPVKHPRKMPLKEKVCKYCGEKFMGKGKQVFCSKKCCNLSYKPVKVSENYAEEYIVLEPKPERPHIDSMAQIKAINEVAKSQGKTYGQYLKESQIPYFDRTTRQWYYGRRNDEENN